MINIIGVENDIAKGILAFAIIFSIAIIRMVTNQLVVSAFTITVFASVTWIIFQNAPK